MLTHKFFERIKQTRGARTQKNNSRLYLLEWRKITCSSTNSQANQSIK